MSITSAIVSSIILSLTFSLKTQGPPPFHPKPSEVAQANLFVSLTRGNRSGVESALKAGANPNEPDFIEMMPLFFAGDVPMAKLLLHHGADIHATTRKGSAVINALLSGGDEVAEFLLQRGAPTTAARGDKMTAMMAAAQTGCVKSLHTLIERHAGINSQDREGSTPLIYAVRGNQMKAVKLLLASGANVSASDHQKRTALHYAAMRGNSEMVRYLSTHGASPSAKDFSGETPLHLAAKYSGDSTTVRQLLKVSRNPNLKDADGKTAADLAARYSCQAVAACFGKKCATPAVVANRTADAAIRPAIHRIQQGLSVFVQKAGCVSCHHQGLGVIALTQAAQHRYSVDKSVIGECFKQMEEDGKLDAAATHAAVQDSKYISMLPPVHLGDQVYGGAYILGALRSAGVPPNPGFAEGVTVMGRLQLPDGRFNSIQRGIMEHSDVMTSALTLGVLKTYWPADRAEEFQQIAARTKKWANSTPMTCAEDLAGRLLILSETECSLSELAAATSRLLQAQRADGGWGTRERQISDSYTTGVCLYALRTAVHVEQRDSHLKRAVAFLVRTQENDGSWYEPKLTAAFNNHFDSSFPHGYDQFASFAGTCWATIGLLTMTP